jgi:hypothetical protein
MATAVLLLSAPPAVAQTTGPQPPGQAIGDAGSALGMLRLLPNAVPTSAILPGASDSVPKQSALEAGIGLSSAQANSEAYLTYERSIAQSSPFGLSVAGNAPQTPGSLVQTALPDNPQPITGGLNAPQNPLLNVGLLNGSAHARWSDTLGPCVDTIADASTSVASLSLLNVIPSLGTLPLGSLTLPDGKTLEKGLDPQDPLGALGGLLSGGGTTSTDGTGSLLNLPNTLSSRSVVKLVDIPGSQNKAVESTSTLQAASIEILKNTPLGLTIGVVGQPTLKVTSTGDQKTSKVEYTAPVLQIKRGDTVLSTLNAANPAKDIPIGLPLAGLLDALKVPSGDSLKNVPIVGGLADLVTGGLKPVTDAAKGFVLDLGVLRLSIAGLDQKAQAMTDPFKGFQLGASARLFDLQVLPTQNLKNIVPADFAANLPSSLAQISLGEQIARAYAPEGGVKCGTTPPAGGAAPANPPTKNLAYTGGAYDAVPMFWTGTTLLLVGVVLVAAIPSRRRKVVAAEPAFKPSPRPRS